MLDNMVFPYVEFLGLAEERIFRPMIPVTFKVGKKVFQSYGLIDSWSDYTILPIEIAGHFNLKLSSQSQYTIEGAGGNSFSIYKSPTKIRYLLCKEGFRNIVLSSYVYFAESGATLLLGQKGFLDQLEVNLDARKKIINITQ